jgi:hypothetical protein
MTNYRKLSSQAEAEIEALRNEGVILSDSDIISINALCWEIESPSKRVSLAKGKPIKCGNVWLWPLTIHSSAWFSDVACDWQCSEVALAYAMAHRDNELFTVSEQDVLTWFKTIQATIEELRVCMAYIIDQSKRDSLPVKKGDGITVQQLAQLMVANHGGTFEMWERQCSIEYVFDFLDTACKQDEAEARKTHVQKATMILGRFTQSLSRKHKANGR